MTTGNLSGDGLSQKAPKRVVIIGGSCAGLFTGIVLARMGHNVDIIEVATSSARYGTAAGIGLAGHVQSFLKQYDRLAETPFALPSECFNVLDENLETIRQTLLGYSLTSWDALYYRLRANFDGLVSPYYPQPPAREATDGQSTFHPGVRALRVQDAGESVLIQTHNVGTGESQDIHADYVVVADGGNSTIRQQLEPALERRDAGYMVWRGTVPAPKVSRALLDKLSNTSAFYAVPGQKSYVVMYTIPGEHGALSDDKKVVNLVWYHWPTGVSREEILTGVDGHCHRTTLPKGHMRPDVWVAQVEVAKKLMHPDIAQLVANIEQPFASTISSIMSTKAFHFGEKLFLVGDALAQVQPNIGLGTNVAAKAALTLRDVFSGQLSAKEFEITVLGEGREVNEKAIALGDSFMAV
ncbi:hypothetical protein NLG97_g964 [Lecanicillium saksenae]|uniref:Uncharacterized protein n=1 Tax=Lecanicillium saksenae TaxID=468837 RepID=A0ACC1R5A0_9HYPO|nr:hypothetical protein NLG97_g964 [Lecanicillium saksenae]